MAKPGRPPYERILRYVLFRDDARDFRTRIVPGLVTVLIVILLNGIGHELGFYEKFELADSDILNSLDVSSQNRADVSIVMIGDDTYRTYFNGKSPLLPIALLEIVEGVCNTPQIHPQAVAVDILTSDWEGKDKTEAMERISKLPKSCPVVWIRDALDRADLERGSKIQPGESYVLGSVLGSDGPPPGTCAAAPVAQPDEDGIVRRYISTIPVVGTGAGGVTGPYYTLIGALTAAPPLHCGYKDTRGQKDATEQEVQRIRFSANRNIIRIDAAQIIDQESHALDAKVKALDKRIVIIGGAYRYARDQYATAIGPLYGAEIQANAIAAEPITVVKASKLVGVEFLVEVVILALMVWSNLRYPWAILLTVLLNALCALGISWSLFNYQGYFLGVFGSLAGTVLGIIADVVFDRWREEFGKWRKGFPKFGA